MDRLNNFITDSDIYARSVHLNFRGRDKFGTTRGGLLTILTYVTAAYCGLGLFDRFYSQVDPVISQYEKDLNPKKEY